MLPLRAFSASKLSGLATTQRASSVALVSSTYKKLYSTEVNEKKVLDCHLRQIHESLGASMTNFQNWMLPAFYHDLSAIESHKHTRQVSSTFFKEIFLIYIFKLLLLNANTLWHIHVLLFIIRQDASVFDVSHMFQSRVYGKDRIAFIERLTVADIQALPDNTVTFR